MAAEQYPFVLSLSKDERGLSLTSRHCVMAAEQYPFVLSLSKDERGLSPASWQLGNYHARPCTRPSPI